MKLTLVCRIQKHQFATSIVDPKGDVKANCFPLHSWCFTNQNNGNVSFNHKTNELTLTVCGDINKGVNGDWLCKHGSDKAIAHVEATVLPYHGMNTLTLKLAHAICRNYKKGKLCVLGTKGYVRNNMEIVFLMYR